MQFSKLACLAASAAAAAAAAVHGAPAVEKRQDTPVLAVDAPTSVYTVSTSVLVIDVYPTISTSTVLATSYVTVHRCPPTVQHCPAESIATQTSVVVDTISLCPTSYVSYSVSEYSMTTIVPASYTPTPSSAPIETTIIYHSPGPIVTGPTQSPIVPTQSLSAYQSSSTPVDTSSSPVPNNGQGPSGSISRPPSATLPTYMSSSSSIAIPMPSGPPSYRSSVSTSTTSILAHDSSSGTPSQSSSGSSGSSYALPSTMLQSYASPSSSRSAASSQRSNAVYPSSWSGSSSPTTTLSGYGVSPAPTAPQLTPPFYSSPAGPASASSMTPLSSTPRRPSVPFDHGSSSMPAGSYSGSQPVITPYPGIIPSFKTTSSAPAYSSRSLSPSAYQSPGTPPHASSASTPDQWSASKTVSVVTSIPYYTSASITSLNTTVIGTLSYPPSRPTHSFGSDFGSSSLSESKSASSTPGVQSYTAVIGSSTTVFTLPLVTSSAPSGFVPPSYTAVVGSSTTIFTVPGYGPPQAGGASSAPSATTSYSVVVVGSGTTQTTALPVIPTPSSYGNGSPGSTAGAAAGVTTGNGMPQASGEQNSGYTVAVVGPSYTTTTVIPYGPTSSKSSQSVTVIYVGSSSTYTSLVAPPSYTSSPSPLNVPSGYAPVAYSGHGTMLTTVVPTGYISTITLPTGNPATSSVPGSASPGFGSSGYGQGSISVPSGVSAPPPGYGATVIVGDSTTMYIPPSTSTGRSGFHGSGPATPASTPSTSTPAAYMGSGNMLGASLSSGLCGLMAFLVAV